MNSFIDVKMHLKRSEAQQIQVTAAMQLVQLITRAVGLTTLTRRLTTCFIYGG